MNFVHFLNLFGTEAQQIPVIILHNAPTTSTEGAVGCLAMNVDSPDYGLYKCVEVNNGVYVWREIVGSITEDRINELIAEAIANVPTVSSLPKAEEQSV